MSDFRNSPAGLDTYSRKDVVEFYEQADYLSGVERHLFGRYLAPGQRILDLGVGGGRTSAALANTAAEYVGIDYAAEMIAACRRRYPALRYEVMDAADLSAFASAYFDIVVFSFNGLGNLHPDSQRSSCLAECRRVLKPGGILIFSLHNSRSLFFRLPQFRGMNDLRPVLGSLWQSCKRFLMRIRQHFYWRGSGYLASDTHGGMLIYLASPKVVCSMLTDLGFTVLDVLGDDYPARNFQSTTRWYYYAARK